jgi:hypothetical protein
MNVAERRGVRWPLWNAIQMSKGRVTPAKVTSNVTVWSLSFPTCSGASPVLRCDYPSCTKAVYSRSCIPTVCSFIQYNISTNLDFFLMRMDHGLPQVDFHQFFAFVHLKCLPELDSQRLFPAAGVVAGALALCCS